MIKFCFCPNFCVSIQILKAKMHVIWMICRSPKLHKILQNRAKGARPRFAGLPPCTRWCLIFVKVYEVQVLYILPVCVVLVYWRIFFCLYVPRYLFKRNMIHFTQSGQISYGNQPIEKLYNSLLGLLYREIITFPLRISYGKLSNCL